jgi:2,5-dihydroxypyridine 5,6-dioxygenase
VEVKALDVGFPELFRAALDVATKCDIKPDENVVIYTDSERNPAVVEAFYAAAVALGCDPVVVRGLARFPETSPSPAAVKACVEADILFELSSNDWLYSPAMLDVLGSKTRVLMALLPERSIIDRPPDPRYTWRVPVAEKLVGDKTRIKITTPEGTEIYADRGSRPWHGQMGYANRSGHFDLYGTCMINCAPIEESVNGVVYYNGLMILYGNPEYLYKIETPVKTVVENGTITTIDTSTEDGRKFDRWIKQFDDPNAYIVSHLGFGFDPRCDVNNFDLAAWESYEGGVLVAFGANNTPTLQGSHGSKGHMDGILFNATLQIDDVVILRDGEFTPESGLQQPAGSGG